MLVLKTYLKSLCYAILEQAIIFWGMCVTASNNVLTHSLMH